MEKTCIFEIPIKKGLINLDWDNFIELANKKKPLAVVVIDDDLNFSQLYTKALNALDIKTKINFIV